jgi:ADP-heptose:LPS heptosyltransferase
MNASDAHNPVLFFVNGLGDCVINLPALRAISTLFDGRAALICEEGEHRYLFDELPLTRTIAVQTERFATSRSVPSERIRGQIENCDLFISMVPWISDSLRAAIGQRISVGFFRDYSIHVPLNFGKHSVDLAFDLARVLDPDTNIEDYTAPPRFRTRALAWVDEVKSFLPVGSRILAVHPDSSSDKMWNIDKLRMALKAFLRARDDFFVFVVGYDPPTLDLGSYSDRIIPSQRLGFALSSCLVARSDLFLGIDSCYLHVADFARVPGVGLFGPTSAKEFGFRLGPNVTIQAKAALDEISTETVVKALEHLVENPLQCATWSM